MTEEINKFSGERPGKDRGKTGERPGNGKTYYKINDIRLIFHTMLTLYEGNKFSGERPGKNERYYKKYIYEVINITFVS